jgi:hypothetical protein
MNKQLGVNPFGAQFNELLFHRSTARFCTFDLLSLYGRDLRHLTLIERKRILRNLVPKECLEMLYVDHLETDGERLFQLTCERDLEGIVAKHCGSRYTSEDGNPAWIKVRNPQYSQVVGRHELFEREPEATYHAAMGWDSCTRICASANTNMQTSTLAVIFNLPSTQSLSALPEPAQSGLHR